MSIFNQITIQGRIKIVDKLENSFATIVTMPAPDEYSSPQNARILSSKRIGNKGDEFTGECRPNGYHRVTQGKRPNADGEFPRYNNCDGYFTLIE